MSIIYEYSLKTITYKLMRLTENKITEIFYLTDEFCREFDKNIPATTSGIRPKGSL